MRNDFEILTYQQRSCLNDVELSIYFERLRDYYLSHPYNKRKQKKQERNCRFFFSIFAVFLKVKYSPITINKKFVPQQNGLIFVSNHTHPLDPVLIMHSLRDKHMHLLAKEGVLDTKAGWLFKAIGSIFVNRSDTQSRKMAKEELIKTTLNNGNIMIFPESTINHEKKGILPFQNGACAIAQVTGHPIIPVAITGEYKRNGSLTVRYGEPIYINSRDNVLTATKNLEITISEMLLSE